MVVKRKAAKKIGHKEADSTVTVEERIEELGQEPSPAVTQVVEVVEEEAAPTSEVVPPEEQSTMPPKEEVMEAAKDEVRKEMVDELFEEPTTPVLPEISVHKKSRISSVVAWVAVVMLVAAITGGGLYFAIQKSSSGIPFLVVEPTPTPTPMPTPTPEPVRREDITIQVLNGGGTRGAAGKMKTFLEEKGYTVSDTGNTDEYTYEETEILVKPGKEAYLSLLEEDLKDEYTLGATSATLGEDSSYDAQIIVGKE